MAGPERDVLLCHIAHAHTSEECVCVCVAANQMRDFSGTSSERKLQAALLAFNGKVMNETYLGDQKANEF